MPQPSEGQVRFGLTTYCSCLGAERAPTCCREEKSSALLRCFESRLAAARPGLGAPGAEPGLAGPRLALPYKAEECAGVGWGRGRGSQPGLIRPPLAGWGAPGVAPLIPAFSLGRGPRLGHRNRLRCRVWQEGRSLRGFPAPDPL